MTPTETDLIGRLKEEYQAHLSAINPEGASEGVYRAARAYYEAELRPLLPADKGARIVDVGCGFGHLIRYFREQGYTRVGGIELDEALHRIASAYIGGSAEFLDRTDGRQFLEEHPESFDLITLFDVIEHFTVDEAFAMLRAMHGALRPGGMAVLRTPNMASLLGAYSRFMDLTHQAGYSEFSFAQILRLAGFAENGQNVPCFSDSIRASLRQKINRAVHVFLYRIQDRTMPACFEKNLVVWGRKGR